MASASFGAPSHFQHVSTAITEPLPSSFAAASPALGAQASFTSAATNSAASAAGATYSATALAMMQKMGYVQGSGLGAQKQGRVQPILPQARDGAGLGFNRSHVEADPHHAGHFEEELRWLVNAEAGDAAAAEHSWLSRAASVLKRAALVTGRLPQRLLLSRVCDNELLREIDVARLSSAAWMLACPSVHASLPALFSAYAVGRLVFCHARAVAMADLDAMCELVPPSRSISYRAGRAKRSWCSCCRWLSCFGRHFGSS